MGKVVCAVHGATCCWRCDKCPKCSGEFPKVGRGDYCPECRAWLKANGYVFSKYRQDYVKAEELPADLEAQAEFDKWAAEFTCCGALHTTQHEACSRCKQIFPLSARATSATAAETSTSTLGDAGTVTTALIEKTAAGNQAVIPGAERRTIPEGAIRPKRKQSEEALPLEAWEQNARQGKLL
jgi:hypothetical protein